MTEFVVELVEILLRERAWIKTCPNDIFSKGLARCRSRSSTMTTDNQQRMRLRSLRHCTMLCSSFTCRTHWNHLAGFIERRQSCRCVCLMTGHDWIRKGVSLSNTTIAAISSNETQREVFCGLHYPKEPQVADFAPREGPGKSSPSSTAIELKLRR
jgi:hypothetical protein